MPIKGLKVTCDVWLLMELHITAIACHLPCHQTEVNTPHLNPSQTGWYSTYLPRRDDQAELAWVTGYIACRVIRYAVC